MFCEFFIIKLFNYKPCKMKTKHVAFSMHENSCPEIQLPSDPEENPSGISDQNTVTWDPFVRHLFFEEATGRCLWPPEDFCPRQRSPPPSRLLRSVPGTASRTKRLSSQPRSRLSSSKDWPTLDSKPLRQLHSFHRNGCHKWGITWR